MYLYIRTFELFLIGACIATIITTHIILFYVFPLDSNQTQIHAYINIGAAALLMILLFRGTYFVARGYA